MLKIDDMPILEFLNRYECSVRLINAMNAGVKNGRWEYSTVKDFLAAGEEGYTALLKVPNLGKRTADEFVNLVSEALNDCSVESASLIEVKDRVEVSSLPAEVLETSIVRLLRDHVCSVRLVNAITNEIDTGYWKYETVGDYLNAGAGGYQTLKKIPNLGYKTAQEFCALVANFIGSGLLTPTRQPEAEAESLEGRVPTESDLERSDPPYLMNKLFSTLTERERMVVECRLGLENRPQQTLEGIASLIGVTRERIRQIEAKAFKKISHPSNKKINDLLEDEATRDFWSSSRKSVLSIKQARRLFKQLQDPSKLIIASLYGSEEKWFTEKFDRIDSAVLRPGVSKYEITKLSRLLREDFATHRMPIRRKLLFRRLRESKYLVDGAITLIEGARRVDGLIFLNGGSRRARRAARLLQILDKNDGVFGELTLDTWYKYRKEHEDDACSPRDLEIIYHAHPHLFINTGLHVWASQQKFRERAAKSSALAVIHPSPQSSDDCQFQQLLENYMSYATGIRQNVYSMVKNEGPQAISSIIRREFTTSGGTAGLVSQEPVFMRMAPGVFGLPEQLCPTTEQLASFGALFTEEQCRFYAMNRHCGEPTKTYPLWSAEYEKQLSYWAKKSASSEIYRSLLSVIKPRYWAISALELAEWYSLIDQYGTYSYAREPDYRMENVPFDLKAFYVLMKFTQAREKISWMSINRCIGPRLDSIQAVWPLMMMMSVGVLTPAKTWQKAHYVTGSMDSWMDQCGCKLEDTGTISWKNEEGIFLLQRIREGIHRLKNTWADTNELNRFIGLIDSGSMNDYRVLASEKNNSGAKVRTSDNVSMVDDGLEESFEGIALDLLGLYS